MKEYKNNKGQYHRENGPSISDKYGEEWWVNGQRHRTSGNGPAVIDRTWNRKIWYINGKRHRKDGPAVIEGNRKEWYINNEIHREDGPAVISINYKYWYINGIYRDEEWVKKYLKIKEKRIICGVIVSDYWKIREVILRWRYNPNLQCVKNRLTREYNQLEF
jgi:hypothetical protein